MNETYLLVLIARCLCSVLLSLYFRISLKQQIISKYICAKKGQHIKRLGDFCMRGSGVILEANSSFSLDVQTGSYCEKAIEA